jgi:TonB family protein
MAAEDRRAASRIFISYRRDDSIAHVNALFNPLRHRFGVDRVFKDTDNIAPGQDFLDVIQSQLKSCSVFLPVIGKQWLTIEKPSTKQRRLDDPDDYLRVEIATALRDDQVLVIPILVGGAAMPDPDDLPPDLAPLCRRNAFEMRDSRWESDVRELIASIERACTSGPAAAADAALPGAAPAPPPETGEFDPLEERRKREVADHFKAARLAFDAGDYEAALRSCEDAIWLDPQHAEAKALRRRTRKAIDTVKIAGWLSDAQKLLGRDDLTDGELAKASDLVDKALALDAQHEAALKLRQEMLLLRKRRERQQDLERQVQTLLECARVSLDEEDFDAAIEHCEDALALRADCLEAGRLRERAVKARDEDRQERQIRRRAQKVIAEARAEFAAGHAVAAIARLEQFVPAHDLIARALEELRQDLAAGGPPVLAARPTQQRQADTSAREARAAPERNRTGDPEPQAASGVANLAKPGPWVAVAAVLAVAVGMLLWNVWPRGGLHEQGATTATSPPETERPTQAASPAPEPAARGVAAPASTTPRVSDAPPAAPPAAPPPVSGPRSDQQPAGNDRARPASGDPQAASVQPGAADAPSNPPGRGSRDGAKPPGRSAPDTEPPPLRGKRAPASAPVRVGGAVKPPTKLKDVSPVYPAAAVAARVQGIVIVEATIGVNGRVIETRVLRSIPLLDDAAVAAVGQWEYTPTLLNGVPVPVLLTVTVNFQLENPADVRIPVNALRAGKDVRAPRKLKNVDPLYPPAARAAGVHGDVLLDILIGSGGQVLGSRILRSSPLLDQAARNAVAQWRYEPTLRDGVAVPVVMTVAVSFTGP